MYRRFRVTSGGSKRAARGVNSRYRCRTGDAPLQDEVRRLFRFSSVVSISESNPETSPKRPTDCSRRASRGTATRDEASSSPLPASVAVLLSSSARSCSGAGSPAARVRSRCCSSSFCSRRRSHISSGKPHQALWPPTRIEPGVEAVREHVRGDRKGRYGDAVIRARIGLGDRDRSAVRGQRWAKLPARADADLREHVVQMPSTVRGLRKRPVCGAGVTLVEAMIAGRRSLGIDVLSTTEWGSPRERSTARGHR